MLGKWIDQFQQKFDAAVDYIVEEDESNDNDREDDQVVEGDGRAGGENETTFPQSDEATPALLVSRLDAPMDQPKVRGVETIHATAISDVGRLSVPGEGLVNVETRNAESFEARSVNLKHDQPMFFAAAHNTAPVVMLNNQDSASEPPGREDIAAPLNDSHFSVADETSLTLQEKMDKNAAATKENSYVTTSSNEITSEGGGLPLHASMEMIMTPTEKNGDPKSPVVRSSSLLQSQGKSPGPVKLNPTLQEIKRSNCADEMQSMQHERSSAERTSPATLSEGYDRLAEHLRQTKAEPIMVKKVSTPISTKDRLPVVNESFWRDKKHDELNTEERSMLLGRISDLEAIVRSYQEEEDKWCTTQKAGQEALNKLERKKLKLEEELKHRKMCIVELSKKLSKGQQAEAVLAAKLQNIESEHTSVINKLNSHHLDVQNSLESEIKDLKEAMHRARLEFDEQACEIDRKIFEANQRAHFAETRLAEAEFRSANFLYDLKTELEDTQKRITFLSSELDEARNERADILQRFNVLKHEHALEVDDHRERLARQTVALAEADKEIQHLKEQVRVFQRKSLAAQHEVEDLKRRCIMLEAANVQTVAPEDSDVRRRAFGDPECDSLSKTISSAADETLGQFSYKLSATQRQNDLVSRSRVLYPPTPLDASALFSSQRDNTNAKSRDRLEKEIIRQAAEIERLKGFEVEAANLKGKVTELSKQYDLLLQMYGQLEEEYNTQKEFVAKYTSSKQVSD